MKRLLVYLAILPLVLSGLFISQKTVAQISPPPPQRVPVYLGQSFFLPKGASAEVVDHSFSFDFQDIISVCVDPPMSGPVPGVKYGCFAQVAQIYAYGANELINLYDGGSTNVGIVTVSLSDLTESGGTFVVTANQTYNIDVLRGVVFKYSDNPIVYSYTGACKQAYSSFEMLLNHQGPKAVIVTIPKEQVIPDCQGSSVINEPRAGTIYKKFDIPRILIRYEDGSSSVFSSWEQFTKLGYGPQHIQVFYNESHIVNFYGDTIRAQRPAGTPVMYPGDPTIYLIVENGQKRPFSSLAMFYTYFPSLDKIVMLDPAEQHPTEGRLRYPAGVLVKGSSPTVYVAVMGQLRPIADLATFNKLGFKFSDIVTVPDGDIKAENIGDQILLP